MNPQDWTVGLAQWLCLVVIITVHEFGHAWMATRCGDDTARLLGRLTLNPLAHIDPIGTVALPLLALVLSLTGAGSIASFIIGWGKPVPFNPANLRRRGIDDMLIAMAGPAMNVLLTVLVMVLARALQFAYGPSTERAIVTITDAAVMMSGLSMFLCFFNLMPIPPLDGSHVLRYLTGMGYEAYLNLCRYGFIVVILVIQIPQVNQFLTDATNYSMQLVVRLLKF